ncbi:NnrU family protein [Roseisalinus antarcticus]|uniref:NnrU protein n=1 Tax=Roseisalinus antarcticus TaxID=254357 RepID=A0A1Y5RQR5_9RHOB|nr:NnrU family protein [Roseisalinus antarcticus]SLN23136.1 NnrU protein [Roseisalinus antarcticus]
MALLILGVALWWAAHLFKRVAPDARAALGDKGRGLVAAGVGLGVVLMVIGYKMADGAFYWGRSPALVGINNLLMLVAFYLFAASGSKTRITKVIRHPQLLSVVVFCAAHLLVNGDVPSFVLFGGLLLWALTEIVVINRAVPDWRPPAHDVPAVKEITAIVAGVVIMGVVALIHVWVGHYPFG